MNPKKTRISISIFTVICIGLALACNSAQLSGANIEKCLARTDFTGMNIEERSHIAWLIDYDRKVHQTKCCAIEPRSSLLAKQINIAPLRTEVLRRIDILETGGDPEARANLGRNDSCHAALTGLYGDATYAARKR